MLELNHQGWILSPNETKKQLLSRKATCEKESMGSVLIASKAHDLTEKIYQFRLENIKVLYSKESIFPWQGALLWSYQRKGENPFPVIQIRKKGLSNENEILAHELVHAARFAFKEPFFEEMLAYQTSSKKLYRLFGPLFIFEKEPFLYLLLSFSSFLSVIFFENLYLLWVPSLFLAVLLLRLSFLHGIFYLAKKHIKQAGAPNPLAVLLRLSDKEIFQTAFFKNKKIFQGKKKNLRVKILSNYFD